MLGYDGWPTYDAEVKMIETGDAIATFIDKISKAAEASALPRPRHAPRRASGRTGPRPTRSTPPTRRYYAEVVRREQHGVDAQEVRRYFDFDEVRQGLLDVTGRLFGLTYDARCDVPTWHDDVASYDVSLGDRAVGRIYLDLHPRAEQVQPCRAVHPHRRRRPGASCPRACWSATSRAA